MCTINKSAHSKKKSGNSSYAPRVSFLNVSYLKLMDNFTDFDSSVLSTESNINMK